MIQTFIALIGKLWTYLGKANEERPGHPSSRRTMTMAIVIPMGWVIAYGFVHCLFFYPQFIIEYLISMLAFVASALGLGIAAKKVELKDPPKAE